MREIVSRQELGDFFSRKSSELTSGQKYLAEYILKNLPETAFMNSLSLSREAEVSNSMVIRLATRLGFSGFPEMQRVLQRVVQHQISSLERYELPDSAEEKSMSRRVLSLEHHVLQEMEDRISDLAIRQGADMLEKASHVFVAGFMANACLAEYMAYFLGVLRKNVYLLRSLDCPAFSRIEDSGEDAVAIIYSFPRYPREAQRLAEMMQKRGGRIIGITDNPLSPLAPLAEVLLEAPMKFISFVDPCAGAFSLSHVLLTSYLLRHRESTEVRLRNFEDFSSQGDFFVRKDLDILELFREHPDTTT